MQKSYLSNIAEGASGTRQMMRMLCLNYTRMVQSCYLCSGSLNRMAGKLSVELFLKILMALSRRFLLTLDSANDMERSSMSMRVQDG